MTRAAIRIITTHDDAAAALKSRLRVTDRTLREARAKGHFAASWYPVVKEVCAEFGLTCPDEAFNWKSPISAPLSEAS